MSLLVTDGTRFELSTDWAGYQKILEVVGERPIRVTYDRGRLELLSPGKSHERRKTVTAALLECILVELEIDFEPGGSTTFSREDLDRGFEPDECYWIGQWKAVQGRDEWKSDVDPPPDLALEVEITRSLLNRLSLYYAIGVAEVWRLTAEGSVIFLWHEADGYQPRSHSRSIPWLSSGVLTEWLNRSETEGLVPLVRAFRAALPGLSTPDV